jgi:RNA polymerase sigma-70 factor, ECF subfamily
MKPIVASGSYPIQTADPRGDVVLVERMRAGDEAALGTLYDRYELVVRTQVLRIVERPMDAEEVVEEVFWQAWRQADRFDASRGEVGAWLRTIARSRSLDRARALKRSGEMELQDQDGVDREMAGDAGDADGAVEAERLELVQRALSELPPEQREVLEMAYYEGMSQSEIAGRSGVPLGTVKTRMRLAIQKLRGALAIVGGDTA